MNARSDLNPWHRILGFLGVGVFCCTLALEGAAYTKVPADGTSVVRNTRARIEGGYQIRSDQVPRAPAVYAYRSVTALARKGKRTPLLRTPTRDERYSGIAAPQTGGYWDCVLDWECDDCDPCTIDECAAEACRYTNAEECELCSDGVYCNGDERCDGEGNCLPATGIKVPDPDRCSNDPWDYVCDELARDGKGDCVRACTSDEDCDDELWCTGVEVCEAQECVGGDMPGDPCTVAGDPCPGEDAYCGGVCRVPAGPPCGEDATCLETTHTCGEGRCCTGTGYADCSRETLADCTGIWFGLGGDDGTCAIVPVPEPNAGEDYRCPRYEAGITAGNLSGITHEAGVADCRPYREVGDDYSLHIDHPYLAVTTVRWIGGFDEGTGSRMRITFYDSQGTFIEDTITEVSGTPGVMLRTVIHSEMPIVPRDGIITVGAAVEFTPDSLQRWAATDTLSVGNARHPTMIYADKGDGLMAYDAVGEGLESGILAFEIVGEGAAEPVGACCGTDTGVCELELPWVCEGRGDFFQGPGTACTVCSNNPFGPECNASAECKLCDGGTRENEPCEDNPLACPGGSCVDGVCDENSENAGERCDCPSSASCVAGTCEVIPPACQKTACCDFSGACTEVIGGKCSVDQTDCVSDTDCPDPQTCEPPCPMGTIGQGFGTSCDPNCCEQPIYTGADTCDQAYFHIINVPKPGEDPITVTITGNNKQATFGDYQSGGGGTCQLDIFDPAGPVRDRGWWEAFCVDACFDMRIDMCCTPEMTGEIYKPQWDFLLADCDPCATIIPSRPVSPPIGTGVDAYGHGAPFCNGDEVWQTYAHLPYGHYFYPIYTGPGGHVGQYQMHVTFAACDVAACCLEGGVCKTGTPNAGVECDEDEDCGNPPAEDDGDCVGNCEMLNLPDCEAQGGYYLGFGNIPPDMESVVTCEAGEFFACGEGACCTGPGVCVDEGPSGETMTLDYCDSLTGTYVGGPDCDYLLNPCPACEIEGVGNCQVYDFSSTVSLHMSDLTVPPFGVVTADDFVPVSTEISSVCVWGNYMDDSAPSPTGPQGYEQFNCNGNVEDNFRVRVYRDDGGFPGAQVGTDRWVGPDDVFKAEIPNDNGFTATYGIPVLAYTLRFEPPIVLPEASVPYWLEVANQTDVLAGGTEPTENTCYWSWQQIFREEGIGNDYSVQGSGDRPVDQGACVGGFCDAGVHEGNECASQTVCSRGYVPSAASARSTDLAFCLGAPGGGPLAFDPPDTPLGSCCECDQSCTVDTDLAACDEDIVGNWFLQNDCATGLCQVQPGESCAGAAAGGVALPRSGLICGGFEPPPAIKVPPEGGLYAFDNNCAPTDPPDQVVGIPSENALVKDIWYQYVTNCTGRLVVSMCHSGNSDGAFDSVFALYSDRSGTCSCPRDSATQIRDAVDETCNGIADAGPGIDTRNAVYPGECWLIRAGGFEQVAGNDAGAALVDIRCVPSQCTPSAKPEHDILAARGGQINQKVRYLSFKIGEADAGAQQAIRVHMVDLPRPYDAWNGTKMFVGPPATFCESAGFVSPPCPPVQPISEFNASTLQCAAEVRDWSAEGVITVYHEGIIPNGVYEVQVARDDCDLNVDRSYSNPLVVTMSRWGDMVRSCATWPCTPPDGVVGIPTDVTALLDKFKNLGPPTSPQFQPALRKARADLDFATPNRRIDITDVTFCVDAFRGCPYPPGAIPPPWCPVWPPPGPSPWAPGGECAGVVASGD
ncbi:MAG: hypothetical protein JSU86_12250 [Phycisphaerales bacterium]|nr:MAG: hypothetical protein JSU86_12250 [Phycisphaerales bacterium]